MVYIYALTDPFTKEIRYIGKSIRPKGRLLDHCNDPSKTWRTNWIQSVLKKNGKPILSILQSLKDDEDWQEAERQWIQKGRDMGWRLTNCTDGGDGLVNPPDEVRQKIILTWLGRKHSEKTKKKIGIASKGRKHSDKSKKHMHNLMKGRKITWADKVRSGVEKLSDIQIREIRSLLDDKVSQYVIADMFGVHQGTISNIKNKRCYQHVE